MRTMTALLILGALTATARAEPPDARAVVAGMKSALEPTRPSIRKLTMRVSGGGLGETSEVVLGQARGTVGTERRTLNVVLAPAKRLWKVERWGGTSAVDGVPTVLRVSMEDLQAKTRTDIDVSAVRYDVPVPEVLLDPAQLSKAASSPLWNELGG